MRCRSCAKQSERYLCDYCDPSLTRRGAYYVLSMATQSRLLTEAMAAELLRDLGLNFAEATDYLSTRFNHHNAEIDYKHRPEMGEPDREGKERRNR